MKQFAVLFCLVVACQAMERLVKLDAYKDAVCLDGSPGAYYIRKGNPEKGWIIHLRGGAMCFGKIDCWLRRNGIPSNKLGSSRHFPEEANHGGILSDDPTKNPYFASWNTVYVIYCDGFSFAGTRKDPMTKNGKKMYLRGYDILKAVLQDLVNEQEMSKTDQIILTGCSAGGMAALIHADRVRDELSYLMKKEFKYHVLADGGYFLDVPFYGTRGRHLFRDLMKSGRKFHQAMLDESCMAAMSREDKWKCLFPKYFFKYIESPTFIVNSLYDSTQVKFIRGLLRIPPYSRRWEPGKQEAFDAMKQEFLDQATSVTSSDAQTVGYFLNSCLDHCVTLRASLWSGHNQVVVQGHSTAETFASWYFNYAGASDYGVTPRVPDIFPQVADENAWPNNPVCGARELPGI